MVDTEMADLPPSYSEAVGERGPPPVYSETETRFENTGGSQRETPRPAWEESTVITRQPQTSYNTLQNTDQHIAMNQPGLQTSIVSQPKAFYSNCFCAACKWRPCTKQGECFCYNCLGFLLYAAICVPGVVTCLICGKVCPETFGDCPNRDWDLIDSYNDRHSDCCSQCFWFMCGPLCCYSCESGTDVCPLATPCASQFGITCRKLTCFCSRTSCNMMDEQAFGFICNLKDCGCKYAENAYL